MATKRIWTKQELTIAYYLAKWGLSGLGVDEKELAESVIGNTTTRSLEMQTANFRYILGIEGSQLSDASQLMHEVAEELKNKTMTQVRSQVLKTIEKRGGDVERNRVRNHNYKVMEQTKKANDLLKETFRKKLIALNRHRNLRPLVCG